MDFKIGNRVKIKAYQKDGYYESYLNKTGIVVDIKKQDDYLLKVEFDDGRINSMFHWRFELENEPPIDYSNFILSGDNNEI